MTLITGIDTAKLTVLLDVRHPLAYLALHPTVLRPVHASLSFLLLALGRPPALRQAC